jgi:hypothetical protein
MMGDFDREPDRERIRETDRTTTVVTGDGGRRGGSGWVIALVLLVGLLALLFFVFGDRLGGAADEVGVNVNVDAPNVEVPDSLKVDVPDDVKVEVPDEVKIDTGGNSAN